MSWLGLVGIQRDKTQHRPRRPVSELAVAWEEIFECNLHVVGSPPEATIRGFACELWGNGETLRNIPVRAMLISVVAYLAVGADRRLDGGRSGAVVA